MKKRTVQPVSFNITDPYEKELLGFANQQQKYFSRYVKWLINKDREEQKGLSGYTSVSKDRIEMLELQERRGMGYEEQETRVHPEGLKRAAAGFL